MSSSVAINVLNSNTSSLYFQYAGYITNDYYSSHPSSIDLYDTGCLYNGDMNCTKACQEPAYYWGSPYALHNCLVYPVISALLAAGNITENGTAIAQRYGILSTSESFNVTEIPATMASCAAQYRGEKINATANYEDFEKSLSVNYNLTDPDFWVTTSNNFSYFLELLCEASPATANSDIGGIGVFISYLMQMGIVLLAWVYGRLISTWLRWAAQLTLDQTRANKHAGHLQDRLDATEQGPALIAGLVEFQKAQAYFSITMQGAAIMALAGTSSIMDATTIKQIGLNVSLIGDVAATSVVCLTFGLYMLHTARKTSSYISCLTLLALATALVTWARTRVPLPHLQPTGRPSADIPDCGGFIDPAKLCSAQTTLDYATVFETPVIVACMSISVLLFFCQSREALNSVIARLPFARRQARMPTLKRQTPTTFPDRIKRTAIQRIRRVWTFLNSTRHGIAEIVLALAAVTMLVWLGSPTSLFPLGFEGVWMYYYETPDWKADPQWTFGQLIAVTIWAPSIIEYIYAAIWGVEEAHEHRFAHPYKVVKDESGGEGKEQMRGITRAGTFYRKLSSHSELELPLVHVHDNSSARSSMQEG